jgi:hypothetical protein
MKYTAYALWLVAVSLFYGSLGLSGYFGFVGYMTILVGVVGAAFFGGLLLDIRKIFGVDPDRPLEIEEILYGKDG